MTGTDTERAIRAATCEGCANNVPIINGRHHNGPVVAHHCSDNCGFACISKHRELLPLFQAATERAKKEAADAAFEHYESTVANLKLAIAGAYEAAAKANCYWCGEGNTPEEYEPIHTAQGNPFWHKVGRTWVICKSAAILALTPADARQARQVTGDTSDGYHTFNELYEHRHSLFSIICRTFDGWKSKLHSDGTMFDGWFIAGVQTPQGQATYHLPLAWWERFQCKELPNAPEWDGHTPADVVTRLQTLTLGAAIASAEARGVRKASEALAVDWEKREPSTGAWLGRAKHAAVLLEKLATELEAADRSLTPDAGERK